MKHITILILILLTSCSAEVEYRSASQKSKASNDPKTIRYPTTCFKNVLYFERTLTPVFDANSKPEYCVD